MSAPRDPELLIRAARLYFEQRRTQDDVARQLGTSRSNVSRILAAAQDLGIVEVRINDPTGRSVELEQELVERFGLRQAIVSARRSGAPLHPLEQIGRRSWALLRDRLTDDATLALSWGTSVMALVSAAHVDSQLPIEVVPLAGGLSMTASEATAGEMVRTLAKRIGARYRHLHAPAVFQSASARDAMLAESMIQEVLDRARHADIAVVGVGSVAAGSSVALLSALGLSESERAAFEAARPLGDVAARFFDADGQEITGPVHDRVLALTLDDIRTIPTVLGIAVGRDKAAALRAALRGGFLDVLACDAEAARGVLDADSATSDERACS